MKTILPIIALGLASLYTSQAQGLIRRADTLLQVLAINPTNLAVADRLMYLTAGRNAVDDGEVLFIDFDKTNTLATNASSIFDTLASTGRWVVRPILGGGSGGGGTVSNALSPLIISGGDIYILPLTNWFTFIEGSGVTLTPTSNTLTIAATAGSGITINESPATNIWNNGIIVPVNDGTGNFSLEYGNESLGTNKISLAFYNWLLSNFGSGGGTTNGFGVNGTFRTDWNFINSAAIAATVSDGTNWYLSIIDGSVTTNKIDSTFYNWVLSLVGSGGGGETNTASNLGTASSTNQPIFKEKVGIDLRFRNLAVGPNLTLTSNANEVVLNVTLSTNSGTVVSVDGGGPLSVLNHADSAEVAQTLTGTNLSASIVDGSLSTNKINPAFHALLVTDALGSGTNVFVNGNLIQPARFTNNAAVSGGVVVATNASGDIVLYATNLPAGSGGGTNIKVNGTLVTDANIIDSPTVVATVAGSDISFTVTNVAGSTTSNVLQRTGIAVFDIYDAGVTYDVRNVYTSGCITNVNMQNGNESTQGRLNISLVDRGTTNYFVSSEIEGSYGDGNGGPVGFVEQSTRTSSYFDFIIFGTAGSAAPQARVSIVILEPVTVGGSGGGGGGISDGGTAASLTITNLTLSKINGLDYYNTEAGDIVAHGYGNGTQLYAFFPAFGGGAFSTGTSVAGSGRTNAFGIWNLRSSASANSGYYYVTDATTFDIGQGGVAAFADIAIAETNSVICKVGFLDVATAGTVVDGAYVRLINGFVQGVLANNSSESFTATSNMVATSSAVFHRPVTVVNTDAASVTFYLLTPSSPGVWTVAWSDSITNTLPTGTSRLTGSGITAYHTAGSANTTLIVLDKLGIKNISVR